MWRSMLKVAVATGVFGVVHSLLASRPAKRTATSLFGERNRNGLYRVFYIGQSLAAFAVLLRYIRSQPSRELYHVQGPLAVLMHAGQVVALGSATWAAHQVGIPRILGLESLQAWLGDGEVPAEPEAQGPAMDDEGQARMAGPFAWSRHPLNFVPVLIFWLSPKMTTNLAAFSLASTVYLVIGSIHEEARLREAWGERYEEYLRSGVPFYWPCPAHHPGETLRALTESPADTPQAEIARPVEYPV